MFVDALVEHVDNFIKLHKMPIVKEINDHGLVFYYLWDENVTLCVLSFKYMYYVNKNYYNSPVPFNYADPDLISNIENCILGWK